MANEINIEVAFALPDKQQIVSVKVTEGTSARDAVLQSGIGKSFPDFDFASADLGIFGKSIKPAQPVQEGDRIEVYRPLIADPKEVRKRRAAEAREKRAKEKG